MRGEKAGTAVGNTRRNKRNDVAAHDVLEIPSDDAATRAVRGATLIAGRLRNGTKHYSSDMQTELMTFSDFLLLPSALFWLMSNRHIFVGWSNEFLVFVFQETCISVFVQRDAVCVDSEDAETFSFSVLPVPTCKYSY